MIGEGGQSQVKSRKIIHEPSGSEVEQLAQLMSSIGISGPDRALLVWGRRLFDEDWISDVTKNWLAVLDNDLEKYEETNNEQEQKILAVMVELDYKALRGSLYVDAQYATAKIEDTERAKGDLKW